MNTKKKQQYYFEVIEKRKENIENLEARIVKAKKIGADQKSHKFYGEYLKVVEELDQEIKWLDEYNQLYNNLFNEIKTEIDNQ